MRIPYAWNHLQIPYALDQFGRKLFLEFVN